jgi:hypothetical protein
MARRRQTLNEVRLTGIEAAPSQVWGAIRLVPLLRESSPGDLRLARRIYRQDFTMVSVGGGPLEEPSLLYVGYIPHGVVIDWTADGTPAVSQGTHLCEQDGKLVTKGPFKLQIRERMAKREKGKRLRFLPLETALEGFMRLHFGGPEVAWSDYSRRVLSHGLSPRFESVVPGRWIEGLEEALRVFEIHEGQVGVMVFVADALASVFLTPHRDDYRSLHRSLLEDFYGELLYNYGAIHRDTPLIESLIQEDRVNSMADLRAELGRVRREWDEFQSYMAEGVLHRSITGEAVYRAGPFQLERFATSLDPSCENHIGELIVRESGEIEYLKTYRLSAAQTRRAFLLVQLADRNWNLEAAATALRTTKGELIVRLEKAGFGYLVHEHVLKTAQKAHRR